jgi:tetratricopeptide (TPR) repeat protein
MVDVLAKAADLDGYIRRLNRQAAETGLDNPLVRKSLGTALLDQERVAQARAQLEIAAELRPEDAEVQRMLVECCDRLEDAEAAAAQLLAGARLSRKNLDLYRDLAERYERLGRSECAERARTTIVEMQPNESESHQLLAEIRQRDDDWEQAIAHWRQVAEIRSLEPEGLVHLAEAYVHLGHWQDARETLQRLQAKAWPSRFGNVDSQIRDLRRRIEEGER